MPVRDDHHPFPLALRRARASTGQRQTDVGAKLGVTASTVSWWEGGKTAPTSDHYAKLLRMFPGLADVAAPDTIDSAKPGGAPFARRGRVRKIGSVAPARSVTITEDAQGRWLASVRIEASGVGTSPRLAAMEAFKRMHIEVDDGLTRWGRSR